MSPDAPPFCWKVSTAAIYYHICANNKSGVLDLPTEDVLTDGDMDEMVNSLNVKRRNGNTWLQELKGIVNFN